MVIHAYDETYVQGAQDVLGHSVDFAVMTLSIDPDAYGNAFAVSWVSKQFANGNPKYVAGMNGCELARMVLSETGTAYTDAEDAMYLDKSPEYWSGWALAYFQWYTGRSFIDILSIVPLSQIIDMYPVYHEMDILQFVDHMNERIRNAQPYTQLKQHRINCGLSQAELSAYSGVSLQQIELYEQRKRNINNASAITLLRLSRALHCHMEDLMEYELPY